VLGNAAMILSNRSQSRSIIEMLRMPNRALWWVVTGALGGLALALYVPAAQRIFGFEPLSLNDLGICLLAASAGVLWSELSRLVVRFFPSVANPRH
jgi:Ca2+-transporting ATPase